MITKVAKLFYDVILQPTSKDKDQARREYILNLLLLGCLILSFVAFFVSLENYINLRQSFVGASPIFLFLFVAFFCALLIINHRGYSKLVAALFVIFLLTPGFLSSIKWGSLLGESVLIYALVVVISGILINSKVSFVITGIISLFTITIAYLQSNNYLTYDADWFQHIYKVSDAVTASVSLGIIALVSWLFNKDTEKALKRARISETALRKQRDLLEVKVEQRTKQLRQTQAEKLAQIYRFAEFGRSASDYFMIWQTP